MRVLEVSNRRDQLVWLQESHLPSQQLGGEISAGIRVVEETEGKLNQLRGELGTLDFF